jgi:hypothetical protein
MGATRLTPQTVALNGVLPTYNAIDATNGNCVANKGGIRLLFMGNPSATTGVVTIAGQGLCEYGIAHSEVTVSGQLDAAAKFLFLGPFNMNRHNDANDDIQITYSGTTTGITVAVLKDR